MQPDQRPQPASPMPAGPWVLIVGMHRSGTSAVTGALAHLGLAVPVTRDRWQTTADNPDHWESVALGLHDDALLEALGGAWDRPPEAGPGWESAPGLTAGPLGDTAAPANAAFPGSGPVVWKDPRVCVLLPYWLAHLPAPVAAVFIWRDPLSVARSLQERDGFNLQGGLALWEWYNHAALSGLQGVDTFVMRYDTLVADPHRGLSDLVAWLGGLGQFSAHTADWDLEAACASVSVDLQHQHDGGDSGILVGEHRTLVEHLESLGGPHQPLTTPPPGDVSQWTRALLAERRHAVALLRKRQSLADSLLEHAEQVANPHARAEPPRGTLAELEYLAAKQTKNGSPDAEEESAMSPATSRRNTRPLRNLLAGRKPEPPGS
jgi:hypothetical protein